MTNWIFDLDYTLYDMKKNSFDYKLLSQNSELNKKIMNLPGRKILYTNGNLNHTLQCMKCMKMEKIFHKICCREVTGFKPYLNSYVKLYHEAKIGLNDKCYFFEDTPVNLVQAKKFNWITILISRDNPKFLKIKYPEIDYIFPDIIEAINYFNCKNN